jgi:hypothetical protein
MKSFTRTLAAAILGAALAGIPASAQNVNVNFQNAAQFTTYHTYTFKNLYTTDALVEPRLAIAIDRNLQMRGWQEVAQGADVLVTAVLASNNDPGLYKSFYSGLNNLAWNAVGVDAPGDAPASIAYAPAGTLIVDMYDSHSGHLIWRSTASDFLTRDTGSNVLKVDNAVTSMFGGLPFEDSPGNYIPWIKGN